MISFKKELEYYYNDNNDDSDNYDNDDIDNNN
jgi:hypothetical protein